MVNYLAIDAFGSGLSSSGYLANLYFARDRAHRSQSSIEHTYFLVWYVARIDSDEGVFCGGAYHFSKNTSN